VHRAQNCGKREQKDRTKTLAEFPNHVLKDYGHIRVLSKRLSKRIKRGYGSENGFQPFLSHIHVFGQKAIQKDKTRKWAKKRFSAFFIIIIYYLNIFIHGSLSVACFSKGRGLKLLKRYKTKSKPKV
jgi:hypothetical protein